MEASTGGESMMILLPLFHERRVRGTGDRIKDTVSQGGSRRSSGIDLSEPGKCSCWLFTPWTFSMCIFRDPSAKNLDYSSFGGVIACHPISPEICLVKSLHLELLK